MNKSTNRLVANAAIIVTTALLMSKITAFLRTTMIPNVISNKTDLDAFYMSMSISDFMFNLLIGGAISSAIIPILSGYIAKKDEQQGWIAISTYINIMFIVVIIICIIGSIFASQIVNFTANNFSIEQKLLTTDLTRILLISVLFFMLSGLINGILYSYKQFAAASFGPSIYNITAVLSIFVLKNHGVKAIAAGIAFSNFVYFIFQFSFSFKYFIKFYKFRFSLRDSGFKKLLFISIPLIISASVVQINIFTSTIFTGMLKTGSLTAYRNASETWQLPYGIFALGIGFAMLPSLSEKVALNQMNEYKILVNRSLKVVLLLNLPAVVTFIIINRSIISIIYKWSNNINIVYTGQILLYFTIALLAQSFLSIIIRAFYALKDTKTPLITSSITIIINFGLCFLFLTYTNLDAAGMALSYSSTAVFNAFCLTFILHKKVDLIELKSFGVFISKLMFSSILMGTILYFTHKFSPYNYNNTIFSINSKFKELLWFIFEISLCGIIYISTVIILKVEEALYLKNIVLNKINLGNPKK
ncbi:MAG: murein biosynthesis integral membrane protein MurJ [Clostridiales bacterium]